MLNITVGKHGNLHWGLWQGHLERGQDLDWELLRPAVAACRYGAAAPADFLLDGCELVAP